MKIFYFTATGNSLEIAKLLGDTFGAELLSIPQVIKSGQQEFSDDKIGVVFPVYAYNLPAIVTRFFRSVKLTAEYTFAVVAHGGDPGNIGGVLAKAVKLDNVYTVRTWSNYLPFCDDVPPVHIDVSAGVAKISEEIKAEARKEFGMSNEEPFEIAPWHNMALDYKWRSNCTACGTCAKVCPVGNFTLDADNPDKNGVPMFRFTDHCEGCMACLQNCPVSALYIPNEPTKYRYRNPNITLEEIIAANKVTEI